MKAKKFFSVLLMGLVIWGVCSAVMGIGMATLPMETILTIHLFTAPVITYFIAFIYFKRFNYTTPLQTALFFLLIVSLMDFSLMSIVILRSFDMFTAGFNAFIGTWLPFMLIFAVTYLTGKLRKNQRLK